MDIHLYIQRKELEEVKLCIISKILYQTPVCLSKHVCGAYFATLVKNKGEKFSVVHCFIAHS